MDYNWASQAPTTKIPMKNVKSDVFKSKHSTSKTQWSFALFKRDTTPKIENSYIYPYEVPDVYNFLSSVEHKLNFFRKRNHLFEYILYNTSEY